MVEEAKEAEVKKAATAPAAPKAETGTAAKVNKTWWIVGGVVVILIIIYLLYTRVF